MEKSRSTNFQANIAQIIRSEQKDQKYIDLLDEEAQSLVKQITGTRTWLQWQSTIRRLTKLAYYSLTTVSGFQTLGEEYCQIIQVDGKTIPSFGKRLLLSILYAYDSVVIQIFQRFIQNDYDAVNVVSETFRQINTVLFFLYGIYPDIPKRLLSIGYISTIRSKIQEHSDTNTRLLGYLSVIHLVLWFYVKYGISTFRHGPKKIPEPETPETSSTVSSSKKKCLLCFETHHQPTLILCGHVFCWNCLSEWMEYKDECPACRARIRPRQMIFLQNF